MKTTLTAIALCTIMAVGATTSAEAYCNTCTPVVRSYAPARVCNTCAPRVVRVEMERVCAPCNTCDPCGRSWSIFNPFSW